jgi:hypothetical protein
VFSLNVTSAVQGIAVSLYKLAAFVTMFWGAGGAISGRGHVVGNVSLLSLVSVHTQLVTVHTQLVSVHTQLVTVHTQLVSVHTQLVTVHTW